MRRAGIALLSVLIFNFFAPLTLAVPLPNTHVVVASGPHELPESNAHLGTSSGRVSVVLQRGSQSVGHNRDGVKSPATKHTEGIQRQIDFDYQSPQASPVRPRQVPTDQLSSSSRRVRTTRPIPPSLTRQAALEDADEIVVLHRRNIFKKIGAAFKKLGKKIKSGFQKAGSAIKKGFQKAGKVMKKGFQKVGHFIKTTGKKIAKGALKVIATVQAVASHVVKFIPVIGNAASTALKFSSKGLNAASDAIHANMGKKWDRASKVMDVIQDPIGSLAKMGAHKIVQHTANKYRPAPPTGKAPSSAPARRGGKHK